MNETIQNNVNPVQKRRFLNAVTTTFILLSVFLAVETLNAMKEHSTIGRESSAITVNGTGEVFAVPDVATLSFSVDESAKTVGEAQDAASKKMNAILGAIKQMGIADKDIKTVGYNSNPKYEYSSGVCANGYCPQGKQTLVGYEVNQTISVKVRKTADAGAVLSKVGELGASNISGLDFVIDDMDTVNAQARSAAITDAKDKAKVLAKSLGVKLVKILEFSESGSQQPPMYYAMDKVMSAGAAPTVPQVPTGENKVTSSVSITYEIE